MMVPFALVVRICEGIWKSVVEPVFEMLKSVEVEKLLVVEEMLKSERAFEVEAAKSERSP